MSCAPTPSIVNPSDKVGSETELMRTLPRARFRGLGNKQVRLPSGTAETLEEFEEGLRLAGFVGKHELIAQTTDGPLHFRVKVRYVSIDGHWKPFRAR